MALKTKWTRNKLIDAIGDQNIYEYYFGQEISLNKCYQSVFRADLNYSTGFYLSKNGHIVYNDFSTGEKLDCVAFVAKQFGVNYYKAMDIIAIDFGLMEGVKSSPKQAVIIKRKPLNKQDRIIKISAKQFTEKDLEFWGKFYITEPELKANKIYSVDSLCINDYIVPKDESELRFAYLVTKDSNQYLKIYSPYSKEFKWISSCPMDAIFGFDELPFISDTLLIVKSQKERLIAKKLFSDVIGLQAENTGAIDKVKMEFLKTKYKRMIYFGDNDKAGLVFCEYMAKEYNIESYHFPVNFLTKFNIKDIANFVSLWQVENLEKWFKINKI